MYEGFIARAREEHQCPLCERGFENPHQEADFKAGLEDVINAVPTKLQTTLSKVEGLESQLQRLTQLRPIWTEYFRLAHGELPALEAQLVDLTDELDVATARQSSVHSSLDQTGKSFNVSLGGDAP